MDAALFDRTIETIANGPLGIPITRLMEVAARTANTRGAMVTCRKNGTDYVFASRGLPFNVDRDLPVMPRSERLFEDGPVVIADVAADPLLANHPLTREPTGWRYAVIVPVKVPGAPRLVALTCGDGDPNLPRAANMTEQLRSIAEVIADELELISELISHAERSSAASRASAAETRTPDTPEGEHSNVTSTFLMSTSIPQRRLLRRGDVSYHVVRRWRAAIKAWQLEALKSLKQHPPEAFVDHVAHELVESATHVYGVGVIQAVAAVPCGHSGADCLAALLAERTSVLLRIPCARAFDPLTVAGSSHPRKNSARPRMRLREPPTVATLLIDDVATSGAHIEEATSLLRSVAPAVFPLVWMAD